MVSVYALNKINKLPTSTSKKPNKWEADE